MAHGRGRQEGGALLQLLLVLVALGLVIVELLALGVTAFQVDEQAREVAAAAADAYEVEESVAAARGTARREAEAAGAELTALEVTEDQVVVTVRARAPTILIHRIGPLRDHTLISAQGRARWR